MKRQVDEVEQELKQMKAEINENMTWLSVPKYKFIS